ncbi:CORE-2/I-BRANCHING BETA-16-N-ACETYLGLUCOSAMINYLTRANSFERASE FAMILY PROTEIN [Salix koriyanagi]|uniref:CORE-2/I-BRANCHING BETA-16-N-ACETYLGLUCOSAMINYLTRANSFERASE FAMILY PROTEIN n=1 Tax=Salix koriyanagi TaxID=2511006 RepID=A0A9Q0ZL80_9ROSI|nr:CORE-2/I-BRANCHING BETA-16-N-ACETYLGLUCOSAMINYLTRANSFERASE FAMILY PROTEIN [Salix koriyanagi]
MCQSLLKPLIDHDSHYIARDNPPKQHPHILTINDTNEMIASGAAFARKLKHDDLVLDKIDKDLLCRKNGSFTPG